MEWPFCLGVRQALGDENDDHGYQSKSGMILQVGILRLFRIHVPNSAGTETGKSDECILKKTIPKTPWYI